MMEGHIRGWPGSEACNEGKVAEEVDVGSVERERTRPNDPPLLRSANIVEEGAKHNEGKPEGNGGDWRLKQKTETASFRYLWF